MPASRAVKVDLIQSLTAIDGPLYLAESAGKPSSSVQSSFRLTHVTALIGGPLVELKGSEKVTEMRTSGLIPLVAEANSCLFVAVPGGSTDRGVRRHRLDGNDDALALERAGGQPLCQL